MWLRHVLGDSNPIAVSAVWWIWRTRCTFCLENLLLHPLVVMASVTGMANDLKSCFGVDSVSTPSTPRLVRWSPRSTDSLVVNVDGSVRDSPTRGGFGGCSRSRLGQWLGGSYGYKDESQILHMELLAMFHGLRIAWDRGARVVECQSDSLEAVTLVNYFPPSRHLYASLIWDIKDLLARVWLVEVIHTLREGNSCADFLVKFGASQDSIFVAIDHPLDGMSLLLLADSMGVLSVRP